jgi:hypothetical protein
MLFKYSVWITGKNNVNPNQVIEFEFGEKRYQVSGPVKIAHGCPMLCQWLHLAQAITCE